MKNHADSLKLNPRGRALRPKRLGTPSDAAELIQWCAEGGGGVVQPPPREIPKALQNRAKLNPNVKTVKNC